MPFGVCGRSDVPRTSLPTPYSPIGFQVHKGSARGSLEGEEYAFSEMVDHAALLREVHVPLVYASPGRIDIEDCDGFFSHFRNNKTIAERRLGRHFWEPNRHWEIMNRAVSTGCRAVLPRL